MRVLLIGGTGTLSTDTTALCVEKGYEVFLFNRGNNNKKGKGIKYIIGDINDYNKANKALKNYNFDVVIDYLTFDIETLIDHIKLFSGITKQYIFISSATVFPCIKGVTDENSPIGNDNWIYSKKKLICEQYLYNHKDELTFNYTIVRPYLTYGNKRIPFPIISKKSNWNLIYRIQNGLPIIMCDDGEQKITITHTRDFAIGICGLFLNEKAYGNDYNIVGDTVITWNEVIHLIEKNTEKKAKIVYVNKEKLVLSLASYREELLYDKGNSHIFNNKKIKKDVPEFNTKLRLEDGVNLTIKYLMENPDAQVIDNEWNSTENILCNKFGGYKLPVKLKEYLIYLRMESFITYRIRVMKRMIRNVRRKNAFGEQY